MDIHAYRMLPAVQKSLLSEVCKSTGGDLSLTDTLCTHLCKHNKGDDDGFWESVDDSKGGMILDAAKKLEMSRVGSFDLLLIA